MIWIWTLGAANLSRVFEQLLENLGGVQQVVAELGGQLTQLLLDLIEPIPSCALYESHTTLVQSDTPPVSATCQASKAF